MNRILFLVHRGELETAIGLYQASTANAPHNHEIIEQITRLILEQGAHHQDPEIQLLSLFGASIATNDRVLYLIEEAVKSPIPQIQVAALGMLAKSGQDGMEEHLRHALRSPFLLIRLEALFLLAESKSPKTTAYAESLMAIIDEELFPIFPEIFAVTGDGASTKMLRRLLASPKEDVKTAAILAVANHKRDDFLPKIRGFATHHSPKQLEACCKAFEVFKDESSVPRLEQLAQSSHPNVRLAALKALYKIGKKDTKSQIEVMAQTGDLFAITALADIDGTEETLALLTKSPNPHIRINAAISLVQKKDERSLPGLIEILLEDKRDYAFLKLTSNGRSMNAWKVEPSAQHKIDDQPLLLEHTQRLKAAALTAAIGLKDQSFLQLADKILYTRQNELIPLLIPLLENKQTPEAIALLKKYRQMAGAPFIRQCCNLALYRLKEEGDYEKAIQEWVSANKHEAMFRFKQPSETIGKDSGTGFELTPDETSKLLIESIEALAKAQTAASIDLLLDTIKNGNEKNKYALAGLLMRVAL